MSGRGVFQRAAGEVIEWYARLPYHRGKWKIIEGLLRMSGAEALDAGRMREVVRMRLRWRLGRECAVQRRLLYFGGFDVHDVREVQHRLGAGSVFCDVGAYFGYYGLIAAQQGARVFAFEPAPGNFELLSRHAVVNRFPEFEALPLALADAVGSARFELSADENQGRGHLFTGNTEAGSVEVKVTTLDAFVRERRLERLDGLKLDVEGAELKVLAGATETIARFKPWMLLELNPPCLARFGAGEEALLGKLRGMGYRFARATRNGLVPFERLGAGEDYVNIFCLPG